MHNIVILYIHTTSIFRREVAGNCALLGYTDAAGQTLDPWSWDR